MRTEALLRRESLPPATLIPWSRRIQERVIHFLPYLISPSVALYSPIGNEVATEEIRDHALRTGKKVFYPKLGGGENLDLVEVKSAEEMRLGRYGILEPGGDRRLEERDREGLAVFIPGIIFDHHGNRLGRGKGWYDRLIELLGEGPRFVALAYEFQVVKDLPVEEWDRKVRHIITERRVIDCDNVASQSGWLS